MVSSAVSPKVGTLIPKDFLFNFKASSGSVWGLQFSASLSIRVNAIQCVSWILSIFCNIYIYIHVSIVSCIYIYMHKCTCNICFLTPAYFNPMTCVSIIRDKTHRKSRVWHHHRSEFFRWVNPRGFNRFGWIWYDNIWYIIYMWIQSSHVQSIQDELFLCRSNDDHRSCSLVYLKHVKGRKYNRWKPVSEIKLCTGRDTSTQLIQQNKVQFAWKLH